MRGLSDDSVTRLDKNEDLALEMRDLTELHWARNFMRSKGDFQRKRSCCYHFDKHIYGLHVHALCSIKYYKMLSICIVKTLTNISLNNIIYRSIYTDQKSSTKLQ